MKKKNQIPKSINDPEKILGFLSEEQNYLLTDYLTKGVTEYYQSMMKENERLENDLIRVRKLFQIVNRQLGL